MSPGPVAAVATSRDGGAVRRPAAPRPAGGPRTDLVRLSAAVGNRAMTAALRGGAGGAVPSLAVARAAADAAAPAPDPVSADPVLSLGAQGEDVEHLQGLLNAVGGTLTVDGAFGPGTRSAVVAFQQVAGHAADGTVVGATWAALRAGTTRLPPKTVSSGASGDVVRDLQTRLNAVGADLAVDGLFGPLTRGAAVAFQQSAGLPADGVVGPATWQALTTRTGRVAGGKEAAAAGTLEGVRDRLAVASSALHDAVASAAAGTEPAARSAGGRRPAVPRSADAAVAAEGDLGSAIVGLAGGVLDTIDANGQALAAQFGSEVAALEGMATSLTGQLPVTPEEIGALSGGLDAVAHGLASKASTGTPVTSKTMKGSTTITVVMGDPIEFSAPTYAKLYEKMAQRADQGLESGKTESAIDDYGYSAEPAGSGFRTVDTTLVVTETVHGCRWPEVGSACAADQAQWKAYEKGIETHELGHVGVDKKAFANGHEKWHGITGSGEADIQAKVDAAVEQLEKDASAANATWHGTPAGALPALGPSKC